MANKSESINEMNEINGLRDELSHHILENEAVFLESVDGDANQIVIGLLGREFALIPISNVGNTKVNSLTVKIDIDVSDALKGLKAVQREAKKTTHLLREIEERTNIKDLTDDEVFKVLSSRGWEIEESVLEDSFGNPDMSSINMYKNHKLK